MADPVLSDAKLVTTAIYRPDLLGLKPSALACRVDSK